MHVDHFLNLYRADIRIISSRWVTSLTLLWSFLALSRLAVSWAYINLTLVLLGPDIYGVKDVLDQYKYHLILTKYFLVDAYSWSNNLILDMSISHK